MRVLLLGLAFLLAGCAEFPAFEPEEHNVMVEPVPGRAPLVLHRIPQPHAGVQIEDGLIIADAVDSFHGDYRLTIDDEGIWCEVEAGPDRGAIGIVNVCSFRTEQGDVLASQTTHEHDFRVLMLPAPPAQPFAWDLRIDLIYPDGNATRQAHHDSIHRLLDLRPQASSTMQMDLRGACDAPDAVESVRGSETHRLVDVAVQATNGWPFITLELDEATVAEVQTDGDAVIEDHLLHIKGPFGASLNATIWIDPEAKENSPGVGGPCGVTLGHHLEPIRLTHGAQGIDAGWVQQETSAAILLVLVAV